MYNQNNNVSESPLVEQQPKPKKHFIKKLVIILSVLIAIWIVLEVNNYSQYVNEETNYNNGYSSGYPSNWYYYGVLPYRPIIVQAFYAIFPSLDKQANQSRNEPIGGPPPPIQGTQ